MELLLGIICGLSLSLFFSFGPAFFSQLHASIQYGFKKSYPFAVGVSMSDFIIVSLMLTVLKNVSNISAILHNVWVASIGGTILVVMGVYYWRKVIVSAEGKESRLKFKSKGGDPRRRTFFGQGFLINFFNPFIWIYWVSIVALVSGELEMPTRRVCIFFVGVLGTTLGLDLLKCKLASLLQRIITVKILRFCNRVCAIIMFAFAAYLVGSMIIYQVNPEAREREQQKEPTQTQVIKKIYDLPHNDSSLIRVPVGRDTGHTIDTLAVQ